MNLSIEIRGWDEVSRRFSEAPNVIEEQFQYAIRASLPEMQSEIRKETPVLTGRLKAGIEFQEERLKGIVMSTVYYGVYVHSTNPFMTRAMPAAQSIVIERFQRAVDNIIQHLSR